MKKIVTVFAIAAFFGFPQFVMANVNSGGGITNGALNFNVNSPNRPGAVGQMDWTKFNPNVNSSMNFRPMQQTQLDRNFAVNRDIFQRIDPNVNFDTTKVKLIEDAMSSGNDDKVNAAAKEVDWNKFGAQRGQADNFKAPEQTVIQRDLSKIDLSKFNMQGKFVTDVNSITITK